MIIYFLTWRISEYWWMISLSSYYYFYTLYIHFYFKFKNEFICVNVSNAHVLTHIHQCAWADAHVSNAHAPNECETCSTSYTYYKEENIIKKTIDNMLFNCLAVRNVIIGNFQSNKDFIHLRKHVPFFYTYAIFKCCVRLDSR